MNTFFSIIPLFTLNVIFSTLFTPGFVYVFMDYKLFFYRCINVCWLFFFSFFVPTVFHTDENILNCFIFQWHVEKYSIPRRYCMSACVCVYRIADLYKCWQVFLSSGIFVFQRYKADKCIAIIIIVVINRAKLNN